MVEYLNVLNTTKLEKLNSVFRHFQNFQNMEALIFSERIGIFNKLITEEADKGKENMEGILNKSKSRIRFLYCPRCGLRRPVSEVLGYYGGHCPSCGCRMVEEGPLPYISKNPKHICQSFYYLNNLMKN